MLHSACVANCRKAEERFEGLVAAVAGGSVLRIHVLRSRSLTLGDYVERAGIHSCGPAELLRAGRVRPQGILVAAAPQPA